jgi:hypothetical protein
MNQEAVMKKTILMLVLILVAFTAMAAVTSPSAHGNDSKSRIYYIGHPYIAYHTYTYHTYTYAPVVYYPRVYVAPVYHLYPVYTYSYWYYKYANWKH